MTTPPNYSNNAIVQGHYVFDAPCGRVFKAWIDSEQLIQWWSPAGYTMRVYMLECRPGGICHYGVTAPEGPEMWGKFIYREIMSPMRLVFINAFADAQGNQIRNPLSPTWPLEVLNTLTFEEQDGKTNLIMVREPYLANEQECNTFLEGQNAIEKGFSAILEQLDVYLKTTG